MISRKLFSASAVLSIALSVPVLAGEVQTPTAVPPPPINSQSAPGAPENGASALESVGAASTSSTLLADMFLSMFWLY